MTWNSVTTSPWALKDLYKILADDHWVARFKLKVGLTQNLVQLLPMPTWWLLTKGVNRGLYRAPWNINNPSLASYMNIHEQHLVRICITTRRTKNIKVPNRKLAILIQNSHFTPILSHFFATYFNQLLLQIEHHRLPIQSVSSSNLEHEKLSKGFTYVKHGECHDAIHFHASP